MKRSDMKILKSKKIIILFVVLIGSFLIAGFKIVTGYYPLSDLIFQLYYADLNNKEPLDAIMIDPNFKFHDKDYTVSQVIYSPYPLPHNMILRLNSGLAPKDIEIKISLKIEIYRNNEMIYSTITKGTKSLFDRDTNGIILGVNGFYMTQLPFPLKRKAYDNILVKVTIVKPSGKLYQYINNASLVLCPNITL